jgi:pyruvate,water dikinase
MTKERPKNPWLKGAKKLLFNYLRHQYTQRLQVRETLRLECTRVFAALRDRFLLIGQHAYQQGWLTTPTDIWFLDLPEVEALVSGKVSDASLHQRVSERQAEYRRYLEMAPLPDKFTSWGPLLPEPTPHGPALLKSTSAHGQGCSPGAVSGKVIWLSDALSVADCQGKILVAPYGDPGLVRFYPAIAGLLLERGSTLSHAAIVARELGIPTVIGIPSLSAWLTNGEHIRLDGTTGHVLKSGQGEA